MKIDAMVSGANLREVQRLAPLFERAGFDGIWFTEGGRTAYLSCAAAALATTDITIGTGIAVAFPRSPMVTAQVAWELADVTGGQGVADHRIRHSSHEFVSLLTLTLTGFQLPNPCGETFNFAGHSAQHFLQRIRQVRVVELDGVHFSPVFPDDPAGHADDGGVGRDFRQHDGTGTYARVVADAK